ncbi:MAG: hypothetical protein AAGI27_06760 [Pseudomonadota bacterium]
MNSSTGDSAQEILRRNDKGGFTVPTSGLYPYQWNWDSVFVAMGFATFDESRACREIETVFDAQWDNGFVPHIIFRRDDPDYFPGPSVWQAGGELPTSGITQPPVAGSVINFLWDRVSNEETRDRIRVLYDKTLRWHDWFHANRVHDGVNAVVITHPWESGRDNSPEWDRPALGVDVSKVKPYQRRDLQHADADMRPTKHDYDRYIALVEYGRGTGWNHGLIGSQGPFRVADVGMTFVLLRSTRDLLALSEKLGRHDDKSLLLDQIRTLEQGADYHWDDQSQTYCSRDVITGEHSGYLTNASFLYAYAGVGSDAQHAAMAAHWQRIAAEVRYMLPSHDPGDPLFDHIRYWRGPVWIMMNYMAARGFEERGESAWSRRLKSDSRELIERFGFHEAFSPCSGEGTGGTDFSWTAALWLAWCGEETD